ncbi:hypothetical protein EZS27_029443 [termite gut metagenome]|uniref:Uncharacterized protein n=1 Tax=termite gut metagenome TaxID=433724 RepID=A0A5J4QH61_9ZZZZ
MNTNEDIPAFSYSDIVNLNFTKLAHICWIIYYWGILFIPLSGYCHCKNAHPDILNIAKSRSVCRNRCSGR